MSPVGNYYYRSTNQAEIHGGVVNYIDYDREQLPLGNTFYSVSYKDIAYKDENEFRLLYWKLAQSNQNLPVDENGVNVAVDFDILIESIYIKPSKSDEAEQLAETLRDMSLSSRIINSRIKEM